MSKEFRTGILCRRADKHGSPYLEAFAVLYWKEIGSNKGWQWQTQYNAGKDGKFYIEHLREECYIGEDGSAVPCGLRFYPYNGVSRYDAERMLKTLRASFPTYERFGAVSYLDRVRCLAMWLKADCIFWQEHDKVTFQEKLSRHDIGAGIHLIGLELDALKVAMQAKVAA